MQNDLDPKGLTKPKPWSEKAWRAPYFETARRAVRSALKSGALVRPAVCEKCGKTPPPMKDGRTAIQAHHHDYSKPLDVNWLCYLCHVEETPHAYGERAPAAKLTQAAAEEIRETYKQGGVSKKSLARRFGVAHRTISHVINGNTWKSQKMGCRHDT